MEVKGCGFLSVAVEHGQSLIQPGASSIGGAAAAAASEAPPPLSPHCFWQQQHVRFESSEAGGSGGNGEQPTAGLDEISCAYIQYVLLMTSGFRSVQDALG
jgi:hypothetical protein